MVHLMTTVFSNCRPSNKKFSLQENGKDMEGRDRDVITAISSIILAQNKLTNLRHLAGGWSLYGF